MTRIVERDDWPLEERDRIDRALYEARFWASREPVDVGFWAAFDSILLANYPDVRYEAVDEQASLDEFSGGQPA